MQLELKDEVKFKRRAGGKICIEAKRKSKSHRTLQYHAMVSALVIT